MFKRSVISLFLFILLCWCTTSIGENYLADLGYKGHVKSIHEKMWQMGEDSAGRKVNKLIKDQILFFSVDSQAIRGIGLSGSHECHYSGYNVTTHYQVSSYNWKIELDEKMRKVSSVNYDSIGNVTDSDAFIYDKFGNLIEQSTFGPTGNILESDKQKYDQFGNCIERRTVQDSVIYLSTYVFGSNGKLVQQEQIKNGIRTTCNKIKYDDSARILEETYQFLQHLKLETDYLYDSNLLVGIIRKRNDTISERTSYRYLSGGTKLEKRENFQVGPFSSGFTELKKIGTDGLPLEETTFLNKLENKSVGALSVKYVTSMKKYYKKGQLSCEELFNEKKQRVFQDSIFRKKGNKELDKNLKIFYYFDENGKIAEKIFVREEYDGHGNCILQETRPIKGNGNWNTPQHEINYKYGGFKVAHDYTYDKMGNMIRQVYYVNGEAELMMEWEIAYY